MKLAALLRAPLFAALVVSYSASAFAASSTETPNVDTRPTSWQPPFLSNSRGLTGRVASTVRSALVHADNDGAGQSRRAEWRQPMPFERALPGPTTVPILSGSF